MLDSWSNGARISLLVGGWMDGWMGSRGLSCELSILWIDFSMS